MSKLRETLERIYEPDYSIGKKVQARLDNLTKPRGSLGRLEELARRIAIITGRERPRIEEKVVLTLAGDHGVVEEGVSAFPKEVTPQMVLNFLRGGAGINVLACHTGCRVVVVDIGVDYDFGDIPGLVMRKVGRGTKNIAKGPSMTPEEAVSAIEVGISLVEEMAREGVDIIGTGDMGIGNTTPSSAIVASITGEPVTRVTGRGTGIDEAALAHKVQVIERALEVNRPDPQDGLEVLFKVGGFEIGGIAGVILGAASHRLPVVIDGFISGASALIAYLLQPRVKDYLIASHCSAEQGHKVALEFLGLDPLLDLDLRLGEGTGAALGISLVEAAVKVLNEMATFGEAGVSDAVNS